MLNLSKKLLFGIVSLVALFIVSCDDSIRYHDNTPPEVPGNVFYQGYKNETKIWWDHNGEKDLKGYIVLSSYDGKNYTEISNIISNNYFYDTKIYKGQKVYYAVLAVDNSNNESKMSYDAICFNPPAEPLKVNSITGDNQVDIFWEKMNSSLIEGYNVYYSEDNKKFYIINKNLILNNSFVDKEAANGVKTYYAVTAVDYYGNESDLSKNVIFNTPRPQGLNYSIVHLDFDPKNSGFNFKNRAIVPFAHDDSDFFFEMYNNEFFIDVWNDCDIKDMGLTGSIHDVNLAPQSDWSNNVVTINNEKARYEKAIIGHTYVIRTWNNYYAKIRVNSISNNKLFFDWAYQSAQGNTSLEKKYRKDRSGLLNEKITIQR